MNCCNEFGACEQGHGCPIRTTNDGDLVNGVRRVKPYPEVPADEAAKPDAPDELDVSVWKTLEDLAISFAWAILLVFVVFLMVVVTIGGSL